MRNDERRAGQGDDPISVHYCRFRDDACERASVDFSSSGTQHDRKFGKKTSTPDAGCELIKRSEKRATLDASIPIEGLIVLDALSYGLLVEE